MSNILYYILDCETTGTRSDQGYHEVIEISIIRVLDKVQLTRKISADHPERASLDALKATNRIKSDSLRITKDVIEELKQGVSKKQAVEDVINFFNQDNSKPSARCLIGHNLVSFDKRFLHELFKSQNKEFPCNLFLDTLKMMKLYIKQNNLDKKTCVKLGESLDLLGIKKISTNMHTAKIDTRNNYHLYKELVDNIKIDYIPLIENHPHIIPGLQKFSMADINDDEDNDDNNDYNSSNYDD